MVLRPTYPYQIPLAKTSLSTILHALPISFSSAVQSSCLGLFCVTVFDCYINILDLFCIMLVLLFNFVIVLLQPLWLHLKYLSTYLSINRDLYDCTTNEQFFRHIFTFDFDLIAVIVISFCISMPHFSCSEVRAYYWFSRWQPRRRSTTSGFVCSDATVIKKPKSILQTKFCPHISIHGWDITTSGLENKRRPYRNYSSGLNFDSITVIGISFCIGIQISFRQDN